MSDEFLRNYKKDKEIIKQKGLELTKVKQSFKEFLMTQEQVKRVYTEEEILASSGDDYFLSFISKGYDPKQNGDIVILDKTGYMQYQSTGTTHGSPNSYDTHVPLLFYGWQVPKGELHTKKIYYTNRTDAFANVEDSFSKWNGV